MKEGIRGGVRAERSKRKGIGVVRDRVEEGVEGGGWEGDACI